ncbi:MAG: hypothetical protein AAF402_04195 [Pseudomonadota bacterium]
MLGAKRWAQLLTLIVGYAFSSVTLSQNGVVIIPLGGDAEAVSNVVTVAKRNGDFDNPFDALESIDEAGESNPHLIFVAPGVYDISNNQLSMKEHVNITGSGKNITKIIGSVGSSSQDGSGALLVGADNTHLQHLTLENQDSTSSQVWGVANNGVTFAMTSVRVRIVDGSGNDFGIHNMSSNLILKDVDAFVDGSTVGQMRILLDSGSRAKLDHSTVSVTGGSVDWGVNVNDTSSTASIHRSRIVGDDQSIRAGTGITVNETYVSHSILTGSVTGDPICIFNFTGVGDELNTSCQPIPQ